MLWLYLKQSEMYLFVVTCSLDSAEGKHTMEHRTCLVDSLELLYTRIQQLEPKAHYIHCMAYCLNLCLQECGSQCHIVRDALHLVADLSNLIHSSPKRLGLFLEIRDTVNPQAPGLKILCLTRWDSTNTCHWHRYKELWYHMSRIGTNSWRKTWWQWCEGL